MWQILWRLSSYLQMLMRAMGEGCSAEEAWRGCRAENRELKIGALLSISYPGLPNQVPFEESGLARKI